MDFTARSLMAGACAIIIAAGAVAVAFSLEELRSAPFIFFLALVIALPIGLGIFAGAHVSGRASWRVAALGGAFTGALPMLLTFSLVAIGLYAIVGAAAGLLVWLLAGQREDDPPPSARRLASLALGAAGVVGSMYAVSSVAGDRSCHNPLRGGGDSISPAARFALQVGSEEWRAVAAEVEGFGQEGDWSILSDVQPDDSFKWFQISLCREVGTKIGISGNADWRVVNFSAYQPQGGESWREPMASLLERVHRRWPDKVVFTGDGGERVAPPQWVPEDVKRALASVPEADANRPAS